MIQNHIAIPRETGLFDEKGYTSLFLVSVTPLWDQGGVTDTVEADKYPQAKNAKHGVIHFILFFHAAQHDS